MKITAISLIFPPSLTGGDWKKASSTMKCIIKAEGGRWVLLHVFVFVGLGCLVLLNTREGMRMKVIFEEYQ